MDVKRRPVVELQFIVDALETEVPTIVESTGHLRCIWMLNRSARGRFKSLKEIREEVFADADKDLTFCRLPAVGRTDSADVEYQLGSKTGSILGLGGSAGW